MLMASAFSAVVAGTYGASLDLITYGLSPEYFTTIKFLQFAYADFGLGDRIFAATIGFLATWWVGVLLGWFLARRHVKGELTRGSLTKIALSLFCVFGTCVLSGLLAYFYVGWDELGAGAARNVQSITRVAHIHNAHYIGSSVGTLIALLAVPTEDGQGSSRGRSQSIKNMRLTLEANATDAK